MLCQLNEARNQYQKEFVINTWKLNKWVKEEIMWEVRKYFGMKENKNTTKLTGYKPKKFLGGSL